MTTATDVPALAKVPLKKQCFVIAPIGAPESDVRRKSDQVLKHVVGKALDVSHNVERADEINRPGLITLQIVDRLLSADLVVADLTDLNANVFYELAIRHAAGKPVIHLISEGQQIPFDVAPFRTIPYDITNPDSIEMAQQRIREQASVIERGEKILTTVQIAQLLRGPSDAKDELVKPLFEVMIRQLGSLNAQVSDLREQVWKATDAIAELPSGSGYSAARLFGSLGRSGPQGNLADLARRIPFGAARKVDVAESEQHSADPKKK